MAEGSTKKWPSFVTVNDDDPKSGYVTLFLDIPELKIKRAVIGSNKATNADVSVKFSDSDVLVEVSIHGNKEQYEYKKKLPEDIISAKSSHKLKAGCVELKLCKAEASSWAPHTKYLMSRD